MSRSRPYEVLVEALGEEALYGDPVVYACLLLLEKQGETDPVIILSTTLKQVQLVKQTLQEEFHAYMAQSPTGRIRVFPPKMQNLPPRTELGRAVKKAFETQLPDIDPKRDVHDIVAFDMFGLDGLPDVFRKK